MERIFEDKMSGAKAERPGLIEAISFMRSGDTLVIWKLSRLGRSLKQLIETVQVLQDSGIELKSLNESIDTASAAGKLLFHIVAAFAQFERDNMIENKGSRARSPMRWDQGRGKGRTRRGQSAWEARRTTEEVG